ncbi:perlucin-like protein isoform X2 [Mizuhopecten yessoensis]|uniref:perlucin-like protein isoform X2 n=1 Tax=Mizuhopecten yessoensis TaxID=6573 RepID=UPI000B45F0B5|nr:perlucin-like protein isoform X2 [Mizuhopecten yessoensis]
MKIFLFVLLVLYTKIEKASGNCRDGWESYNNKCYLFSHEKTSWSEASAFCTALHSHLATVLSANEHNYIISAIHHHTGASLNDYWIDGTDEEVESVWRWASTDEEFVTYIKWGRNQPDQAQGGSCLLLWSSDNYLMGDGDCTAHLKFICQTTSSFDSEIVG